ncbi:MAG: alginate export family protein [Phycisphaerae bacterium]|nr:alginate export family protein [Phycisphaerae bacterium]HQA45687.1 alginate export family protein [Phycisphaerae bacterium]HXK86501.1 alginate export family protein [Phycisphaerae bacterium]
MPSVRRLLLILEGMVILSAATNHVLLAAQTAASQPAGEEMPATGVPESADSPGDGNAAPTPTSSTQMPLEDSGPSEQVATRPAETPPTTQPSWVDRLKQPIPQFKWGADYRFRWEYLDNAFTLDRHTPDDEWSFLRLRPRVWSTITPTPGFDINSRFIWESRQWFNPEEREGWDCQNGLFDILNAKVKIPDTPVTMTLGRQEIILGDGWLVLDGTPLDGSTTLYFDAARFTFDLKDIKTTADVIYIQQWSDTDKWLPPINDRDLAVTEQNEIGAILYVSNKSIDRTTIDGYFIYKGDEDVLPNGDDGDIYTFGGRFVRDWTDHITTRSEGAFQFGERNRRDVCAFGTTNRATYFFRDPLKNQLRLNYEFLSGDNPGSKGQDEAFEPLWGRWPQWSELLVYTMATETRVGEMTNLHRIGFGWQAEPTDKLTLAADYHLLFADENTFRDRPGFSKRERFRGQLLTGIIRYKFNRFLSGHIIGEYFWPGDYYAAPRDDPAAYLRMELMFTF